MPGVACVVSVIPVTTAGISATPHYVTFQTVNSTSKTLRAGFKAFKAIQTVCCILILFQSTLLFTFVICKGPVVSSDYSFNDHASHNGKTASTLSKICICIVSYEEQGMCDFPSGTDSYHILFDDSTT